MVSLAEKEGEKSFNGNRRNRRTKIERYMKYVEKKPVIEVCSRKCKRNWWEAIKNGKILEEILK